MYVILRDGTVIEYARILAAGPGSRGMAFAIEGRAHVVGWYGEPDIQTIRFDRDTLFDPPPAPGPDDFKIGTRWVAPGGTHHGSRTTRPE